MTRVRVVGVLALFAGGVCTFACASDDPEENPSFMAGDAGSPAGGEPGSGDAGRGQGGAPEGGLGGGGTSGAGTELAGAGGTGPQEPPYDCVLNPTTHVEIINACTDAVRIEKRPTLPPIE